MLNFRDGFGGRSTITCFQGNSNLASRVKMFDAVIDNHDPMPTALGGRSMGARAAVIAAKERTITHLILVSYPLQSGKEIRDDILLEIGNDVKVLFVSGDHDAMCDLEMLEGVRRKMKAKSWKLIVHDADHGMIVKPRKATRGIGELIGEIAAEWIGESNDERIEGRIWWEHEAKEAATWSGWEAEASDSASKVDVKADKRKLSKSEYDGERRSKRAR